MDVRGVNDGERAIPRGRLLGWIILVAAMATLAYSANALDDGGVPDDILFRWSTAVGSLVQYGIMLAIGLALMRGLPRPLFGFRQPGSWWRAAALVAGGFVTIFVVGAVLDLVLKAGEEQGLVPDDCVGSRLAPFIANVVVVVAIAPAVEELVFRGVGLAALTAVYGAMPALVVSSLAFGLAHGLVVALPVLAIFGLVLGVVRQRSGSIYPAMVLHGIFNGTALLLAVVTC